MLIVYLLWVGLFGYDFRCGIVFIARFSFVIWLKFGRYCFIAYVELFCCVLFVFVLCVLGLIIVVRILGCIGVSG